MPRAHRRSGVDEHIVGGRDGRQGQDPRYGAGAPSRMGSDAGGDTGDVVDGPVGSAFLKEPGEAARSAADLDALPSIEEDDAARPADDRP